MNRICLWLILLSVSSFAREVPVRYLTTDDSLEREAVFVKLVKDTVYLREYTPEEMAAKQAKALAEAEEQAIIEKYAHPPSQQGQQQSTFRASRHNSELHDSTNHFPHPFPCLYNDTVFGSPRLRFFQLGSLYHRKGNTLRS